MKKIPTVFVRDHETGKVDPGLVTPGCEWVLAGEGVPTRKVDGTCVMFDGDRWWARREVKPGKTPPLGWWEVDADRTTGKRVGWEPIEQSPFVKFWREAVADPPIGDGEYERGTFELVGPRINGNPERFSRGERHVLVPHTVRVLDITPYSLNLALACALKHRATPLQAIEVARERGSEGIVWHHPDGSRAKLKVRDLPGGPA